MPIPSPSRSKTPNAPSAWSGISAEEWHLDPKRVGLLGFSAGANLAGHAAWDRGERTYPQKPELDDPRGPDFVIFIYGGGFLDKDDEDRVPSRFQRSRRCPTGFFPRRAR